jgi:hypothetical protein
MHRFHLLGEFDDGKRSCRKRLADHNRRRRKPQANASQPGGPSAESIGMKSGDDDRANGMWPTLPSSSGYHLFLYHTPSPFFLDKSLDVYCKNLLCITYCHC